MGSIQCRVRLARIFNQGLARALPLAQRVFEVDGSRPVVEKKQAFDAERMKTNNIVDLNKLVLDHHLISRCG